MRYGAPGLVVAARERARVGVPVEKTQRRVVLGAVGGGRRPIGFSEKLAGQLRVAHAAVHPREVAQRGKRLAAIRPAQLGHRVIGEFFELDGA